MTPTESDAQYMFITVTIPVPGGTVARVKRWLLAHKTVYSTHGNPVRVGGAGR